MNIDHNRRAVFTVLSEVVEGTELWRAMWCWQQQFSHKSQFELNGFLSACSDIQAIAGNRANLYRRLISCMMLEEKELKADPIAEMQNYADELTELESINPFSESADVDDWSEVFSSVTREIFSSLRSDSGRSIGTYAQEQAERHALDSRLAYAFTLWRDNPGSNMDIVDVELAALRKLLNYIYIGLCERLGPVDADRILSRAIKHTQDRFSEPDVSLLL